MLESIRWFWILTIVVVFGSPAYFPSDLVVSKTLRVQDRWGYREVEFTYQTIEIENPDGGNPLIKIQYVKTRLYPYRGSPEDVESNSAKDDEFFRNFVEIVRGNYEEDQDTGTNIADWLRQSPIMGAAYFS